MSRLILPNMRPFESVNQLDFSKLQDPRSGEMLVSATPITGLLARYGIGRVLMQGYMNQAAVELTQERGLVTFFSRTDGKLWTKGETSGNTLEVVRMFVDCDADSLLIQVCQNGPTCHTGDITCFQRDTTVANNGRIG